MSLAIMGASSPDPAGAKRTRAPRRRQIPTEAVTDGQLVVPARVTSPPRRIGKGGKTYTEKRQISDEKIAELDAACEPRWVIAAAAGLSERQVYRRLKKLRDRRKLARAVQAVMDETTIYG